MDHRDFIGAINRFKVVVTQYQTTRHVEEALERLTEAYTALGIIDEAQTAAAVLGHNFPESPWYKDAYNLVKTAARSRTKTSNPGSAGLLEPATRRRGRAAPQTGQRPPPAPLHRRRSRPPPVDQRISDATTRNW